MNICELCQLSSPSGCAKLDNESCLKDALKLLKRNATNGEILKTMFPNLKTGVDPIPIVDLYVSGILMMRVDKYWWNAPYKAGDTE